MEFTKEQVELLKEPILAKNVKERDGNQAGTFQLAYVEGWHVIDEANRIFGFDGWTSETIETNLVAEEQKCISYTAKVRITIGDVIREGTGAGHGRFGSLGEKHESAIKEAETDARKRAFMQFGNQFGLSLYNGKDKSWKTNKGKPQINKGEVIETLREQVAEVAVNKPQSENTFLLAKNAVETAKSVDQLLDHQKNIAIRFRDGKLTQQQKTELDNTVAKMRVKLK
jgi:DNA repair and recombination protein RAD52